MPEDEGVPKNEVCHLRYLGEDIVRLELHHLLRAGCRILAVLSSGIRYTFGVAETTASGGTMRTEQRTQLQA